MYEFDTLIGVNMGVFLYLKGRILIHT